MNCARQSGGGPAKTFHGLIIASCEDETKIWPLRSALALAETICAPHDSDNKWRRPDIGRANLAIGRAHCHATRWLCARSIRNAGHLTPLATRADRPADCSMTTPRTTNKPSLAKRSQLIFGQLSVARAGRLAATRALNDEIGAALFRGRGHSTVS